MGHTLMRKSDQMYRRIDPLIGFTGLKSSQV